MKMLSRTIVFLFVFSIFFCLPSSGKLRSMENKPAPSMVVIETVEAEASVDYPDYINILPLALEEDEPLHILLTGHRWKYFGGKYYPVPPLPWYEYIADYPDVYFLYSSNPLFPPNAPLVFAECND